MKRNMDLVRAILLEMEKYPHGYFDGAINVDDTSSEEILFHAHLMSEAGLITAIDFTSMDSSSPEAMPRSITWSGYEFLEASRDQTVWEQTKTIVNKMGGASLSIWTNVLNQMVMNNLGLGS